MHLAAFHHGRADRNRQVHVTVESQIACGTRVDAPPVRLELVDNLHGAYLGRAAHRSRRKCRAEHVDAIQPFPQPSFHVRRDVHHVRVAFDCHRFGEPDRPRRGHAPDVVAAQVGQHHVLRALLRISEQFALQREVLVLRRPAAARSGDRAHRNRTTLQTHQDFG